MENSTTAWVTFIEIQQKEDEEAKDYVVRYVQAETALKNVKVKIPDKALAIHLLHRSNL